MFRDKRRWPMPNSGGPLEPLSRHVGGSEPRGAESDDCSKRENEFCGHVYFLTVRESGDFIARRVHRRRGVTNRIETDVALKIATLQTDWRPALCWRVARQGASKCGRGSRPASHPIAGLALDPARELNNLRVGIGVTVDRESVAHACRDNCCTDRAADAHARH